MSDAIKFDKNIPIPPARPGPQPGGAKLENMKVGDSFVGTKAAAGNAWAYAKVRGWTIVRRKMPDGTFRVWRTK